MESQDDLVIDWQKFMSKKDVEAHDLQSPAVVTKFAFLLARQGMIMERLPYPDEPNRLNIAWPLLAGIASNAKAAMRLYHAGLQNEMYPILRSLIERIITFFYLQFCDEKELENYLDYSKQKTYRFLERSWAVKEKGYTNEAPRSKLRGIKDRRALIGVGQ